MTPDSPLAGQRVGIVGVGLVASLLAIHLGRRGATVDVFEKRPDLRRHDIPGGRTIVMPLSDRGWHALAEVDLEEAVRPNTLPKESRAVHDGSGTLHVQPYGADGQAIVARSTIMSSEPTGSSRPCAS